MRFSIFFLWCFLVLFLVVFFLFSKVFYGFLVDFLSLGPYYLRPFGCFVFFFGGSSANPIVGVRCLFHGKNCHIQHDALITPERFTSKRQQAVLKSSRTKKNG